MNAQAKEITFLCDFTRETYKEHIRKKAKEYGPYHRSEVLVYDTDKKSFLPTEKWILPIKNCKDDQRSIKCEAKEKTDDAQITFYWRIDRVTLELEGTKIYENSTITNTDTYKGKCVITQAAF